MRRLNLSVFIVVMAAVLGNACLGYAASVTATLTGLTPFGGADLYLNGSVINGDGVGLLEWNGASGNSSPYNGGFTTFCMDLAPGDDISIGKTYTFSTAPLATGSPIPSGTPDAIDSTKLNELEELFGSHLADLTNTDAYQAFQLAIWNILYDTDTSVSPTNGTFYVANQNGGGTGVSDVAMNQANGWLAEAANPPANALYDDNLTAMLAVGGGQNQLSTTSGTFITTGLPVPSAALGGAVLMAALAVARYRRRLAVI